MLYKKIILNFKKSDEPTDFYVDGNKIELTHDQQKYKKQQPKSIILRKNLNTNNEQVVSTKEKNEEFILSSGFKNYIINLWKNGRYSPIHLLPDQDKQSLFSKMNSDYIERVIKDEGERRKKKDASDLSLKDDFFSGWFKSKNLGITAFNYTLKPLGKTALKKIGSSMSSMAKSMKMDGPIKGIFKKMGIDIEDVKEEGEIFVENHDKQMDFNDYFFRCRGSKGAQDFLIFTSIGIGGKIMLTILGFGAAGAMIANPLTAPIGCILMAMSAKKGFEAVIFESPKKLASIIISLAQGIKDKNTKVKIIDEDGKVTQEGYKAIQNEINNELPGLVSNSNNSENLPGLETQTREKIDENWSNLSDFERSTYEEIASVCQQNREMQKSKNTEIFAVNPQLLSGISEATSSLNNQNNFQNKLQDRSQEPKNYYGGKGTDLNQKNTPIRKNRVDISSLGSSL
jgi:hypothetical protein